mgnify:CR=1 FL=1
MNIGQEKRRILVEPLGETRKAPESEPEPEPEPETAPEWDIDELAPEWDTEPALAP